MKRRTFLQLAPFAVIGLTACAKSDSAEATNKSLSSASSSSGSSSMETNQIIDDMDEDYEESGLTLEEARYYSKTYNCAYFIRRADDGMFYPVAVPLVAIERSKKYTTDCVFLDSFSYKKYASMGSFQFSLSEGDELVYISEEFATPDTVELYPVTDSTETFPFVIDHRSNSMDVYPNGSYEFDALHEHRYDLYDQLVTSSNKSFIQTHHAYQERHFSDYDPSQGPDANWISNSDGPLTATLLNGGGNSGEMPTTQINGDGFDNMSVFVPNNESTTIDDFDPSSPKAQAEIGYYEGSNYKSFVLSADCLAIGYSTSYAYQASTTLTQDGYSVVDISNILSSYELPDQPIQFVINCNYYRFEVDGIPFFAFIAVHP